MMKQTLKRISISFFISAFAGLIVNLAIDVIVNQTGKIENFISMSPEFVAFFPTPAIAAYVNIILYGLIGVSFSAMVFVFEIDKIGFVMQNIIYFILASIIPLVITTCFWQLQRYPQAFISTLAGYGISFLIMGIVQYKDMKKQIKEINEFILDSEVNM